MRRRDLFSTLAAAGIAAAQTPSSSSPSPQPRKGRLKQCVTRGVFDPKMSFDEMCRAAADLGCVGFDLVQAKDWPVLKKYGLRPTMAFPNAGVSFNDGINNKEHHDAFEKTMHPALDEAAAGGCPNLITVSGVRKGMSDAQGADNSVAFLNRVKAHAEDKQVTIALELLNSKIDHKDQMCDHTTWAVDVIKRVNSPNVKVLFDIYHMQIMEGDICRTIRDNIQWLAHFHTGGVPGRHEIDDTQELNYRFVAKTLAELGFNGYIAHEYKLTPGLDGIKALKQAVEAMTV